MFSTRPSTKLIDDTLINRLCRQAMESPRLRTNANLHTAPADPIQRFLNVMQPGTYVRPHQHDHPEKWELTVILSGRLAILVLDPAGKVCERIELDATGPVRGLEIPPRTWHSSAVLATDTVILEVKPGPYDSVSDKDFATWCPAEGETGCIAFEQILRKAQPGDRLGR